MIAKDLDDRRMSRRVLSGVVIAVAAALVAATTPVQAATKDVGLRVAHANARATMFQCDPSFSGPKDGIGECTGRLDVSFKGAPAALKAADFSCEVLLRYWWRDGKEKRWEWKSVQVTAPAAQLGNRFADAVIEFRTDLTSIINEPRGADVKQVQCDITYQTI